MRPGSTTGHDSLRKSHLSLGSKGLTNILLFVYWSLALMLMLELNFDECPRMRMILGMLVVDDLGDAGGW